MDTKTQALTFDVDCTTCRIVRGDVGRVLGSLHGLGAIETMALSLNAALQYALESDQMSHVDGATFVDVVGVAFRDSARYWTFAGKRRGKVTVRAYYMGGAEFECSIE